jgi:two-component system NtrC family sensor kinase
MPDASHSQDKKMMGNGEYYKALTRRMVLFVVLVSYAPLILIALVVGYSFEYAYKEKVIAQLKEMVEKHQQNIDLFLNEKLAYLRVLARSFPVKQLADEGFLKHKLALLQESYGGVFVDLGVVNARGVQVAYAGAFRLERADYSEAHWFQQAIQREYYISDVFLGLRRQPHFIVAVKQVREGAAWIVRATIDFEAFNALVESIRVGKTGSAFILNGQGEYQTRVRSETGLDREFFIRLLGTSSPGDPASPTRSGHLSPGERSEKGYPVVGEAEEHGKEYLYVMTTLKGGEWILVFQQAAADAFEDLYRARLLAGAIYLVGGLSILAMAGVVSRRLVKRIEQSDREKEMMNEQVIEAGKLASIGELAAGIAHEINNPVAIMVEEAGWMEDLLAEAKPGAFENFDEFKRALSQVKTQGVRCKEITYKLLSFARKTDPKMRDVQLNDLVEEIVGISEQRARYSNVKITKNLSPDLPIVSASPSELQQVFLNLINNAIDAIGSGGGTIDVTTRVDGGFAIVDVADSGQGIPKSILPRIFDPFFTTKPVGKGSGLGLSICYGIVKKMGGQITVNSAVGIGTTFHVHIPLEKGEAEAPESRPKHSLL